MASGFITLERDVWTSVFTTVVLTTFQNRSPRTIYLNTGSTTGVPLDEGVELEPLQAFPFLGGLTVSAAVSGGDGLVFYIENEV